MKLSLWLWLWKFEIIYKIETYTEQIIFTNERMLLKKRREWINLLMKFNQKNN